MNKTDFDALSTKDRALVEEGYIDGYAAAVEIVESCVQRLGDSRVDQIFIYNRNTIVSMLRTSLK